MNPFNYLIVSGLRLEASEKFNAPYLTLYMGGYHYKTHPVHGVTLPPIKIDTVSNEMASESVEDDSNKLDFISGPKKSVLQPQQRPSSLETPKLKMIYFYDWSFFPAQRQVYPSPAASTVSSTSMFSSIASTSSRLFSNVFDRHTNSDTLGHKKDYQPSVIEGSVGVYGFKVSMHNFVFDFLHVELFDKPYSVSMYSLYAHAELPLSSLSPSSSTLCVFCNLVGIFIYACFYYRELELHDMSSESVIGRLCLRYQAFSHTDPMPVAPSPTAISPLNTASSASNLVPSTPSQSPDHFADQLDEFEVLSLYSADITIPKSVKLPIWLAPLKMVFNKETAIALLSLVRLASTYQKGLKLSNAQLVSALILISRYYSCRVPLLYSKKYLRDLEMLERLRYLYRYTIASYGWKAINFLGKGSGMLRDSVLDDPDKATLLKYLVIPEEDLLEINYEEVGPNKPRYFVAIDRIQEALIISLRGSMSASDWMTSLDAYYLPYKDGYVHTGFYQAGIWVKDNLLKRYVELVRTSIYKKIILVGHSLGAASAGLAKILYEEEFPDETDVTLECFCFGVPPSMPKEFNEVYTKRTKGFYSIIYGNDFASRLSYGGLMDLRALLKEAAEYASLRHLIIEAKEEELGELFDRLDQKRSELHGKDTGIEAHPKMYIPGTIFYIYELKDGMPVKDNNISESMPHFKIHGTHGDSLSLESEGPLMLEQPEHVYSTVVEVAAPEQFVQLSIRPYMFAHHGPTIYERATYAACISRARGLVPESQ